MIPDYKQLELADSSTERQPSRTYRLDLVNKRVVGKIDTVEAMKQAILKILLTERYAYLVYNWFYGIGLEKYIGLGYNFLAADIETELKESLKYDDRILNVDEVTVSRGEKLDAVVISFKVQTIFGVIEDRVVNNLGIL